MAKKKSEPSPTAYPSDDEYQVKDHARTLLEAEAIKADPEKMKKVSAHLHKQKTAITSIQGLKEVYNSRVKAKKKAAMNGSDGSDAGT